MKKFSTNEAARKLGLSPSAMSKYIRLKRIPTPDMVETGRFKVHLWTEEEIENIRQLLPKIANGRKTRYQKKKSAGRKQHSGKAKKKK